MLQAATWPWPSLAWRWTWTFHDRMATCSTRSRLSYGNIGDCKINSLHYFLIIFLQPCCRSLCRSLRGCNGVTDNSILRKLRPLLLKEKIIYVTIRKSNKCYKQWFKQSALTKTVITCNNSSMPLNSVVLLFGIYKQRHYILIAKGDVIGRV